MSCILSGDSNEDEVSRVQMMKNEISLTLSNKFEIPDNDQINTQSLLLRFIFNFIICLLRGCFQFLVYYL